MGDYTKEAYGRQYFLTTADKQEDHAAMVRWLTLEAVREAYPKTTAIDGSKPIALLARNGETEFCFVWRTDERIEPYGVLPIGDVVLPVYAR